MISSLYIIISNRNSIDKGYVADDDSDSSSSALPFEEIKRPARVLPSPDDLVSTADIRMRVQPGTSGGMRKCWDRLVSACRLREPHKSLLCLTDVYIDYLAYKLNALFYKYEYTDSAMPFSYMPPALFPHVPTVESLTEIFASKKLSQLIETYHMGVNKDEIVGREEWRVREGGQVEDILALFALLEKDFSGHHRDPMFRPASLEEHRSPVEETKEGS